MPQRDFGLTLDLRIAMRATDAGGRARPIDSGSRPLCVIDGPAGQTMIGLCEIDLDRPIAPGESGLCRLWFDVAVSDEIRALLQVGSRFSLADGTRPFADAEVRAISPYCRKGSANVTRDFVLTRRGVGA